MKIPLRIIEGNVLINVVIISHRYRIGFASLTFVVDTGSNETFIGEGDALRLNIPIAKLPFEKHIRMAGSTFELLKMSDMKMKMYLKNDEGKSEIIELPLIYLARTTKKDEKDRMISQAFPSILGMDFLYKNKFSLYVNPYKNIAYLER